MSVYEIPSFVALASKLILLAYATRSPIKTALTRIFLALLVLLSLFNLVEFSGFKYYATHDFDAGVANLFGFAYVALLIPSIAVLLHISLKLSFDFAIPRRSATYLLLYVPVAALEYLLLFTDKLIIGFRPFLYTILREPGSLYFLFETYVIVYVLATFANLLYGARRSRASMPRTRNRLWLFGLSPMALLLAYLIVANHFGWTHVTSTVYLPIGMTFFLVVTTYATHQYRLFDIQFYVPWSKVRKRKTAFYDRIRAMITEIADLGSLAEVVRHLSDTLRCPVAFLGANRPVLASAGASTTMAAFPVRELRKLERIVVANEISETMPILYSAMKVHRVAAIVPFYPHSRNACSWLLLGDSFSEEVYTSLDFRMVEQLFDIMADQFLDRLILMRSQLADAHRHIRELEMRMHQVEINFTQLQNESQTLRAENTRLLKEQPADSLSIAFGSAERIDAPTITLLGRDKEMLARVRQHFPQVEHFVGANSASFQKRPLPNILICRIDDCEDSTSKRLRSLLQEQRGKVGTLIYGRKAQEFLRGNKAELVGSIIESIATDISDEILSRKIHALTVLKQATHAVSNPDYPLIGQSKSFCAAMAEAAQLARLDDPIFIKAGDAGEAAAVAAHMHALSHRSGNLIVASAFKFLSDEMSQATSAATDAQIADVVMRSRHGTLMIENFCALSNDVGDRLLAGIADATDVRLIAACGRGIGRSADDLVKRLRPFTLEVPELASREIDIQLLAHYYTLQFNLQTGTHHYLSQNELDSLIATGWPASLGELRLSLYEKLKTKSTARAAEEAPIELALNDVTLDEQIAQFEARIIEQTLKRCGGNKSKTARLLGLRPNTLHYKLERYGLSGTKKH